MMRVSWGLFLARWWRVDAWVTRQPRQSFAKILKNFRFEFMSLKTCFTHSIGTLLSLSKHKTSQEIIRNRKTIFQTEVRCLVGHL